MATLDSNARLSKIPEELSYYNSSIEKLRVTEFPQLEGTTYLDHAGATLPSVSLINTIAAQWKAHLLGNPHSSIKSCPSVSHNIVESTRFKVLELFHAEPEHFDVVFVANATAGIKLVADAFAGHKNGFEYLYHKDAHTSLVGVRELAKRSYCFKSDAEVDRWLISDSQKSPRNNMIPSLFAYPAQSNMNGRRLPLGWSGRIRTSSRRGRIYTLLDVAALVSTSPIDLSDHRNAPDFIVLSFYKMFGLPNLGALIVRKDAAYVFEMRRYFGGGTTEMITCGDVPWAARKPQLHVSLEDGTGATHSVLALQCAIDVHERLFGSFEQISAHTTWLAKTLYDKLKAIHYSNGQPVCHIYEDPKSTHGDSKTQGATVAFNVHRPDGTWIGSWEVGQLAASKGIDIRTGSLCNPAGMADALGLTDVEVQRAYDAGFRCGQENDVRAGVPFGMVRVSLGAMSTIQDVEVCVQFIDSLLFDDAVRNKEQKRKDDTTKPRMSIEPENLWQYPLTYKRDDYAAIAAKQDHAASTRKRQPWARRLHLFKRPRIVAQWICPRV